MRTKHKPIKIVEKKLGRQHAWGFAYHEKNLIELDLRLRGKKRLMVLVHECIHRCFSELSEREVTRAEQIIGNALWEQNYRKVDQ